MSNSEDAFLDKLESVVNTESMAPNGWWTTIGYDSARDPVTGNLKPIRIFTPSLDAWERQSIECTENMRRMEEEYKLKTGIGAERKTSSAPAPRTTLEYADGAKPKPMPVPHSAFEPTLEQLMQHIHENRNKF